MNITLEDYNKVTDGLATQLRLLRTYQDYLIGQLKYKDECVDEYRSTIADKDDLLKVAEELDKKKSARIDRLIEDIDKLNATRVQQKDTIEELSRKIFKRKFKN